MRHSPSAWLAGWQKAPSRCGVVCSAEPRPVLRCGYREVGFRPRHRSGCYVAGEAQAQTLRGCSLVSQRHTSSHTSMRKRPIARQSSRVVVQTRNLVKAVLCVLRCDKRKR